MGSDHPSSEFWQGIRRPVESASTLPAEAYVSEGFFEAEQAAVFDRGWVGVACVDELSAGTVLVRPMGARSVLVTRNEQGDIHAFLNACRHRGTELLDCDSSGLSMIRCPYHRWGYRLDGTLVATPRFTDVPVDGFDPADYPLRPVRVEVFAGLVFVCLDPNTVPIADYYGDLSDRLAGYRLEGWTVRERSTFEINANWKLLSENFQEYYHLTWVHPELAKVSRVKDHYRYQGPGMYCGQTTTPVSGDDRNDWLAMPAASDLSVSDAQSGRFLALFPNVLLSVLPNHVFVIQLEPLSPGRTRERCTWLLPPGDVPVDEATFALTRDFWIDVNNEDIEICERSQRGLTSGGFTEGRYSVRYEEPLHRFANMLADHFQRRQRVPDGDRHDDGARFGDGPIPV
ncbi:MAG: aromatic ring-hydroxylating oxygenase subunit alpha [Acidimicrobiales bacterium]